MPDTSVYASRTAGFEREESTPGTIFRAWLGRVFALYVSEPLMREIERTLAAPYFEKRISPELEAMTARALRRQAIHVELTRIVTGVASHPEDDLVLATAVSAQVDYLVTGDRQLLALGRYRGVRIVSPRDFLAVPEERAVKSGQ